MNYWGMKVCCFEKRVCCCMQPRSEFPSARQAYGYADAGTSGGVALPGCWRRARPATGSLPQPVPDGR
jgi:hypothetical protein